MRPLIDGTFVLLLLLTCVSYVVAERPGPSLFWVLLAIATVKGILIQGVFMQLSSHRVLWAGLTLISVGIGLGIGMIFAG